MKTTLLQFKAIGQQLTLGLASLLFAASGWAAKPTTAGALADAYAGVPASQPPGSHILRNVNADELQVNRYTTVSNVPDESDSYPLAVTAKVHFPRGYVATVGDAVKYLLLRTGYELGATDQMDDHVRRVFSLRLPESNRVMGPYRVDNMLKALMGNAFTLNVDQNSRYISYSSNAAPAPAAVAAAPVATPNPSTGPSEAVASPVETPVVSAQEIPPTAQAASDKVAQ